MSDELKTIGEMCADFEVTPRTLRFYEAKELLFPIRQGQKRLFTKADRARLKLILRGKRFGFSLEDIRQLLELYSTGEQGNVQLKEVYTKAKERLSEMRLQRDELNEAIVDLEARIKWGADTLRDRGVDPES